jgi:hypothetical protein
MLPATAWDDAEWGGNRARAWSVMGTLRERQRGLGEEARAAQRRLRERGSHLGLMTAAARQEEYEDSIKARWHGGPNVLALLFAHSDSEAIASLDARGEYFDARTHLNWDLFFPGYYKSTTGEDAERRTSAVPVGRGHLRDWYFNARDFNLLRETVESLSGGRWTYSGGTDLVLVGGWMLPEGEPLIDWESTISGCLSERSAAVETLSLPEVVERISRDIERQIEDSDYGVGPVIGAPPSSDGNGQLVRDIVANALGGIVAALWAKTSGLE